MSAALLNPWMLLGLVALAAPVIAHLVQRRERSGQPFPSLMFLRRIPLRIRRRHEIRNPWLLALRCLLVTLVVLAFADPRWRADEEKGAAARTGKDVVLLLDRSYSMAHGQRWSDAVSTAGEVLRGLGTSDRAALVGFDVSARVLVPFTTDGGLLDATLSSLSAGFGATDFSSALATADDLFADSMSTPRKVVLVSDLQRSGLHAREPRLREDIQLSILPVLGEPEPNLTLMSARLDSRQGEANGRLSVRVRNTGAEIAVSSELVLEADGRRVAGMPVTLAPSEEQEVFFPLVLARDRATLVHLALEDDGLAPDNELDVVLAPPRRIQALIVESEDFESRAGLFIAEAMRLSRHPEVSLDRVSAGALAQGALNRYDLIVFADAALPTGDGAEALAAFVEAGGGVLLLGGDPLAVPRPAALEDVLPGTHAVVEARPDVPARITELVVDHPVFEPFAETPTFDLSSVFVYRYHRILPGPGDRVLARFDEGAPALLERTFGAGRALAIATALDERWSTLALDPAFAPLVLELVRHLSGVAEQRQSFRLGESIDLRAYASALPGGEVVTAAISADESLVMETPGGSRESVPASGLFTPEEVGVYEIHRRRSGAQGLALAVNPDRRESDPGAVTVEDLQRAIVRTPKLERARTPGAAAADQPTGSRWPLAWYILAFVLAAAFVETFIGARMDRTRGRMGYSEQNMAVNDAV